MRPGQLQLVWLGFIMLMDQSGHTRLPTVLILQKQRLLNSVVKHTDDLQKGEKSLTHDSGAWRAQRGKKSSLLSSLWIPHVNNNLGLLIGSNLIEPYQSFYEISIQLSKKRFKIKGLSIKIRQRSHVFLTSRLD